ncbi:flagellar biosynthesis anti-sigma factor FlgM [Bdellovibrionota bacterium FG-1]
MRVDQTASSQVQSHEAHTTKKSEKTDKAAAAHGKKAERAHAGELAEKASEGDAKTEISGRAKEMAHAKAAATDAPETREEKIAALKARISASKYKVDNDAVADRLVDDHLQMSGIG